MHEGASRPGAACGLGLPVARDEVPPLAAADHAAAAAAAVQMAEAAVGPRALAGLGKKGGKK